MNQRKQEENISKAFIPFSAFAFRSKTWLVH